MRDVCSQDFILLFLTKGKTIYGKIHAAMSSQAPPSPALLSPDLRLNPPPTPPPQFCPSGFIMNPSTGNCFKYIDARLPRRNALMTCSSLGPNVGLAVVHNEMDNAFITSMCNSISSQACWFGLMRKSTTATCTADSAG